MPLDDLYRKIVAIQEFDIAKETMDIINENSDFLSDLLKRQLASGVDGSGEPKTLIRKGKQNLEYSNWTIKIKEEYGIGIGHVTDRITHQMSGEFYHSIRVQTTKDTFEFVSDVSYFEDILLHSGSGSKIMELEQQYLDLFSQNILIPELQLRFETQFNAE